VTVARIPTLAEDPAGRRATALGHLTRLIDLYGRGMREVLPLVSETSAAFVEGGEDRARRAWTSDWNYEKEDRQPEHVRAFGGQTGFDELLARPGFAEYAHRLWDPLLAVEELSDR
jgi:exodeoxyribonuclease V gamma subunit